MQVLHVRRRSLEWPTPKHISFNSKVKLGVPMHGVLAFHPVILLGAVTIGSLFYIALLERSAER